MANLIQADVNALRRLAIRCQQVCIASKRSINHHGPLLKSSVQNDFVQILVAKEEEFIALSMETHPQSRKKFAKLLRDMKPKGPRGVTVMTHGNKTATTKWGVKHMLFEHFSRLMESQPTTMSNLISVARACRRRVPEFDQQLHLDSIPTLTQLTRKYAAGVLGKGCGEGMITTDALHHFAAALAGVFHPIAV